MKRLIVFVAIVAVVVFTSSNAYALLDTTNEGGAGGAGGDGTAVALSGANATAISNQTLLQCIRLQQNQIQMMMQNQEQFQKQLQGQLQGQGQGQAQINKINYPVQGVGGVPIYPLRSHLRPEEGQNWKKSIGPALEGRYEVRQLAKDIDAAGIFFVHAKIKIVPGFTRQGAKLPSIEVSQKSHEELVAAGYTYVGDLNTHAGSDVPAKLCAKKTLVKAAKLGIPLVRIEEINNTVAFSLGLNLFGNGVKANSEGSITGGGGIGPSWAKRTWETGAVAAAYVYTGQANAGVGLESTEETVGGVTLNDVEEINFLEKLAEIFS